MKERLGLTEAQVSQIEKLRTDERRAAIQRRADTQLARLELEQLMKADPVDEKAIATRVKQLTDLHGAALRARVDGRLALKRILTPEQHEKLRQLRAERPRLPRGVSAAGRVGSLALTMRSSKARMRPGRPPGRSRTVVA
jgi:Spy/CpxP family protein refolding chaperone